MGKYCFTCGGFGFEDKVCPECGHEPLNKTLDLDKVKNVSEFVKKIDNTEIPAKYHGIFWSREVLERDNQDKLSQGANGASDKLFTWYCDQLQLINDVFANNRIPHKSAIIIAPAGYSKITFAYSCMQRALNAGFTVAPLLDTCEVKRALILACENPRYQINKYLSYEDYIYADVMFITVTKLYVKNEAYQVIEEILDRRSRKGLSTFILSRASLEDMSARDVKGDFKAIKRDGLDDCKYPAIIRYTDQFSRRSV